MRNVERVTARINDKELQLRDLHYVPDLHLNLVQHEIRNIERHVQYHHNSSSFDSLTERLRLESRAVQKHTQKTKLREEGGYCHSSSGLYLTPKLTLLSLEVENGIITLAVFIVFLNLFSTCSL